MNELIMQNENAITDKIFTLRGLQVMIDRDLAELYGVETKVFNQAVKRNSDKFPEDFRFQLTLQEKDELVTNCDRLMILKYSSVKPYAFTEQGVSMLSAVIKSNIATEISIKIVRTFVAMRKFLTLNGELFQRLENIEKKQLSYELKTDEKFEQIFNAIEDKSIKPKQGIFYDGQIFDAYVFVSDLVKSAKSSIVLIDNFVDESVLMLLSKRASTCKATIYTKTITKELKLDLQKHNAQYASIEIKEFKEAHDRFVIIDEKEIYHIGASLKDVGKKWFAFSKFESSALEMLGKLR